MSRDEPETPPTGSNGRAGHDDGHDSGHNSDHDGERVEKPLVELVSSTPRPPRRRWRPFRPRATSTVFTIRNAADRSMTFSVAGAWSAEGARINGWAIDFGSLNVQMNDLARFIATYHRQDNPAGRKAWRHTAQEIGKHLYQGLLDADPALARSLITARRRTRPADDLALVFAGPRDYLSVPYELLHDGRAPLAVRHALCRQLTDVQTPPLADLNVFFDGLRRAGSALRVLLISSGARQVAADQEIEVLETLIPAAAEQAGVAVAVDVLWAGDASLDTVRQRLAQGPYHLVHYAGHIYHDRHSRTTHGTSGLLFGAARAGLGQALLPVSELIALLSQTGTQLFFASACLGPQVWDDYSLRAGDDYLELIAALVRAGIPYVLGFRWYARPAGRQRFVRHFYERLFTAPHVPERAALVARQAVYRHDSEDETWASPILIAQAPYCG